MLYDLNVAWPQDGSISEISKTLAVLRDLGYTDVALSVVTPGGKIPKNFGNPMAGSIDQLRQNFKELNIYTRLTVVLDDSSQNTNFSALRPLYDLIAVRPMSEKQLQICCNLDPDLISIDTSKRLPFYLRHKTVCAAVERGVRLEICYASGGLTPDSRKQIISNAASVIRASRSRGIIISSETSSPLHVRGPYDVVNLAVLWGLDHMRARDAVGKEPGLVVRTAQLRANSYKQTIEEV